MNAHLMDLIDSAVEDCAREFAARDEFASRHGGALKRSVQRRRTGRAVATGSTAAVAVGAVAWTAQAVPWGGAWGPGGNAAACVEQTTWVTPTPVPTDEFLPLAEGENPDDEEVSSLEVAARITMVTIDDGEATLGFEAFGPDGEPLDPGSWSYEVRGDTVEFTIDGHEGVVTEFVGGVEPGVSIVVFAIDESIVSSESATSGGAELVSPSPSPTAKGPSVPSPSPSVVCVTPSPSASPSASASSSPVASPTPSLKLDPRVPDPSPSPSPAASSWPSPTPPASYKPAPSPTP